MGKDMSVGLVFLAHKFSLDSLFERCMKQLPNMTKSVEMLLMAQELSLDTLFETCLKEIPRTLSFKEVEEHPRYKEIDLKDVITMLKIYHADSEEKTQTKENVLKRLKSDLRSYGCAIHDNCRKCGL